MSQLDQRAPRARFVHQTIATAALAGAFGLVAPLGADAAELFWSANGTTQGGAAADANAWNTTNIHWGTAAGGPYTQTWNNANADSATFGGTAGVVEINDGLTTGTTGTPISVNVIKTTILGYSFGNGNSGNPSNRIAFTGAGSGVNAQHTSGSTTITANWTGTLNKTGPGRLELGNGSTANTVKYVISGGFVTMAAATRLSGTAPGSLVQDFITFDGGGLGAGNTAVQDLGTRGITLNAGGAFLGASGAGDGTGANDVTISSPVVGTGGLTVTTGGPFYAPYASGGIWRLTNSGNTYQGATTVAGGTLVVDGDGTLGNGAGNLNLSGGKFAVSANRSVSSDPIINPINVTANSVIASLATGASVNLNLSSNTVGGTGGTLTFRNESATPASAFLPRFSGQGFDFPRPIVIDNGTGTKTTQLASFNQTGTQTFSGAISGTGSFNRSSGNASLGGTTIFTGNNTYTGATIVNVGTLSAAATGVNQALGGTSGITINSAGLLSLGNNNQINNAATMNLNGGEFDTGGSDETLAALTQSSASGSVIDLGAGSSILKFADSSGATWNGTGVLSIWNWDGLMTGGGLDQLYFGTAPVGGLTPAQLALINFYSDNGTTQVGTGGATFVGTEGEVVPVPEPTSIAMLALGGMSLLARRRR